jgi:hypothetical protein
MVIVLDTQQRCLQFIDQTGFDRILDHGEAVIANPVGVELNVDRIRHFDLPTARWPAPLPAA